MVDTGWRIRVRCSDAAGDLGWCVLWLLVLLMSSGCGERESSDAPDTPLTATCDSTEARQLVEDFGRRLNRVSLLAPDTVRVREIRLAYEGLVTDELLDRWLDDPSSAPGRSTSSPWPERINVESVESMSGGGCQVSGATIWVTSADSTRTPITLILQADEELRIAEVRAPDWVAPDDTVPSPGDSATDEQTLPTDTPGEVAPATEPSVADAVAVVRRFQELARSGAFLEAYELWEIEPGAEEPPFEEFAAALAALDEVSAEVGEPGRVEGAAGSRYVQVPATIRGTTTDGTRHEVEVVYTLRRAVVDGASEESRQWRIYRAEVNFEP